MDFHFEKVGESGKKIYPGNEMTVTVKNVDLMARTIDFEAVDR